MTKPDRPREAPLSAKQRRAVTLLAAGRSVTETAKEVGVARQTVSTWQRQFRFQGELDMATNELVYESRRELRALTSEATAAVREVLRSARSDTARLQAARLVL